jgi:hypothetical protein
MEQTLLVAEKLFVAVLIIGIAILVGDILFIVEISVVWLA